MQRRAWRLVNGKWSRRPAPLNLAPLAQRRLEQQQQQQQQHRAEEPASFPTLAAEATIAPSLQARQAQPGARLETVAAAGQAQQAGRPTSQAAPLDDAAQLPLEPVPPKEGECCMSGCAHCVYDLYMEDLELYHEQLESALARVAAHDPQRAAKLRQTRLGGKQQTRESTESRAQESLESHISTLDPTMKAFLALERSLKQKQG